MTKALKTKPSASPPQKQEATMAEALVSIAAEKLTTAVGQQLMLFAGAKGQLERLKDSLESILAVLADAENKQLASKSVQLWFSSLRTAPVSSLLAAFEKFRRG
ncbi:hypothetical protein ACLOJK_008339 [Asimina triloba]